MITQCDVGIKFIFLMHPKEAKKQRTGTGFLSRAALKGSRIFVGVDFTDNCDIQDLLSDKNYFPMLLFPTQDAVNISDEILRQKLIHYDNSTLSVTAVGRDNGIVSSVPLKTQCHQRSICSLNERLDNSDATCCNKNEPRHDGQMPLVFVIDGTWSCAKKIVKTNAALFNNITKISFIKKYSSIYTFKREPKDDYISTIESCYYLIKEFQGYRVARDCNIECLMSVFKALIKGQLIAQNERIDGLRPNTFPQNYKYKNKKVIPSYLDEI